jgi:hypothetical protein
MHFCRSSQERETSELGRAKMIFSSRKARAEPLLITSISLPSQTHLCYPLSNSINMVKAVVIGAAGRSLLSCLLLLPPRPSTPRVQMEGS